MENIKFIFIFSIIFLLATNVQAYVTCDGGYSPYPVKCAGEDNSQTNPSVQSEDISSTNPSTIRISDIKEMIWIIAGILIIIYFSGKIFKKNRRR
jgi:hypothetical protein